MSFAGVHSTVHDATSDIDFVAEHGECYESRLRCSLHVYSFNTGETSCFMFGWEPTADSNLTGGSERGIARRNLPLYK